MKTLEQKIKSREYSRQWRLRHPDRYKQSTTKGNHGPGRKLCYKKWRERKKSQNPLFFAMQADRWRRNNPERWRELIRKWKKKRYWKDPGFRLKQLVSSSIHKAVKKGGTSKYASTCGLLGCDIGTLKKHLELKFLPGMNWVNAGKFGWHIDHIRPISSFNLNLPDQQRLCFHYTNLQPMWWGENLSKAGRLEWT